MLPAMGPRDQYRRSIRWPLRPHGNGATGTSLGELSGSRVSNGWKSHQGGSRPTGRKPAGPFNPGRRGELKRGDAPDRDTDCPGVPGKHRTAKSSTMRGP